MKKQRPEQLTNIVLSVLVILVLVVIAYMLIGILSPQEQARPAQAAGTAAAAQSGLTTITTGDTGQGNVEIALTPQEAVNGRLEVALAANTHSVDLSTFDLKKITTLAVGGKTLTPVSAPSLSGHHVSGTLVFEGVAEKQPFTIVITGIPGVESRVFAWQ